MSNATLDNTWTGSLWAQAGKPRRLRPSEVADRFEAAADLLMEKGWCRFDRRNEHDHLCLVGAFEAVTRTPWNEEQLEDTFAEYLDRFVLDRPCFGVAIWNDQQTDRRKVVRHLRRAARYLRSGDLRASDLR